MRRLLSLLALACAAPAAAQVPGALASTDTLMARARRVEAHFFAGRTAAIRAMADSALAARITDRAHADVLLRLLQAPDLAPAGGWETDTDAGRLALVHPYRIAGQALELVVVFDEGGQVVNLLMREGR